MISFSQSGYVLKMNTYASLIQFSRNTPVSVELADRTFKNADKLCLNWKRDSRSSAIARTELTYDEDTDCYVGKVGRAATLCEGLTLVSLAAFSDNETTVISTAAEIVDIKRAVDPEAAALAEPASLTDIIDASVDKWITTHGIKIGATEEEVAQIKRNATDINRLNTILGVDITNLIPRSRAFDVGTGESVLTGEEYEGLSVRYLDNTDVESGYVNFIRITFDTAPPTEQGKPYTFSFFAKGTPSSDKLRVNLEFSSGSCVTSQGNTDSGVNLGSYFALSEEWERYWITVTPDDDDEMESVLIRVYYGAEAYVCGLQLQNGDTATPWTDDEESVITLLDSSVKQNAADIKRLSQEMADKMSDLPLSVVDGKLCITYTMEESS